MCQNLDLRFRPFIVFYQVFFSCPFFTFLTSRFIVFSPFFDLIFLLPFVFPFFSLLFCTCFFLAHVVSSVAYPNLLGNKRLGCCWLCILDLFHTFDAYHVGRFYELTLSCSCGLADRILSKMGEGWCASSDLL
jgi:hypothetical protein